MPVDNLSVLGSEQPENNINTVSIFSDTEEKATRAKNIAEDKTLVSNALGTGHPAYEDEYQNNLEKAEASPTELIQEGLDEELNDTLYGLGELISETNTPEDMAVVVNQSPLLVEGLQGREPTPEELTAAAVNLNAKDIDSQLKERILRETKLNRALKDLVDTTSISGWLGSAFAYAVVPDSLKDEYDAEKLIRERIKGIPEDVLKAGWKEIGAWAMSLPVTQRYDFYDLVQPLVWEAADGSPFDTQRMMDDLMSAGIQEGNVEKLWDATIVGDFLTLLPRATRLGANSARVLAALNSTAAAKRIVNAAKRNKKLKEDMGISDEELINTTDPFAAEYNKEFGTPNLNDAQKEDYARASNAAFDADSPVSAVVKALDKDLWEHNAERIGQEPTVAQVNYLNNTTDFKYNNFTIKGVTPSGFVVRAYAKDPNPLGSATGSVASTSAPKNFVEEPWTLDDLDAPGLTANQFDYAKDPAYFSEQKDISSEVKRLTPDEYLNEGAKILASGGRRSTTPDEIIAQRSGDRESIDFLKERMQSGKNVGVPYLNYKTGAQEGMHRALAAKELGMETIPVQIIRSAKGADEIDAPSAFTKLPEEDLLQKSGEDAIDANGDPVFIDIPYTYDDLKQLEPEEPGIGIGTVQYGVASSANVVNRFVGYLVEDAILARDQGLILLEKVKPQLEDAFKGLNKEQQKELSDVLQYGNDFGGDIQTKLTMVKGKEFTEAELRGGVGPGLKRMNDAQVASYFKVRALMKDVYRSTNYLKRQRMLREGMLGVPVKASKGSLDSVVPGKIITEGEQIKGEPGLAGGTRIYNPEDGTFLAQGSKELNELRETHEIAELSYYVSKGSKDTYKFLLVPKGKFRPLPQEVIRYQPGWMPQIEKTPFAYLRMLNPGKVNGVPAVLDSANGIRKLSANALRTIARGSSIRSVTEWTNSQDFVDLMKLHNPSLTDEQIKNGKGSLWDVDTDANREGVAQSDFSKRELGDARNRFLMYDITGEGRIPVHQALSIAVSRARLEMGQAGFLDLREKQFMKYLRENNYLENPGSGFHDAVIKHPDAREQRALKRYHRFLKDMQRIPSAEDVAWRNKAQEVALMLEKSDFFNTGKGQGTREMLLRLGNGNPADQLRGAAFHAFLGVFMPAQLFVQASQMAVSLSLHPTYAPKVLPRAFAMRLVMNTDGSKDVINQVAKTVGMDKKELLAAVEVWNKTGLKQSVYQSADHNAALAGEGFTSSAARRISKASLFFYAEGETASRLYAFNNAVEHLMQTTGKKWSDLDADDIVGLHRETQRTTFMLDRANAALFQKGIIGVPTQFWQITTKTMENFGLMPGSQKAARFTANERLRIAMGQAALFGAAGIPFGHYFANNIGAALGFSPAELSAEAKAGIAQGFQGLMQQWVFGTQFDTASRMSLMNGFEVLLENFTDEKPLPEQMFGAFGGLFGQRVMPLVNSMSLGFVQTLSPEEEAKISDVSRKQIFEDAISIFSTGNAILKSWYMLNLRELRSANGSIIYRYSDDDPLSAEAAAQFLGFAPLRISEHWDLKARQKAMSEDMGRVVQRTVDNIRRNWLEYPPGHEHHEEEVRKLKQLIYQTAAMYDDPEQQAEFIRRVNTLANKDTGLAVLKSAVRGYNKEPQSMKAQAQPYLSNSIISNEGLE